MNILATDLIADHGSVVIFEGRDDIDNVVRFAVDHRMAQGLVDLLEEYGEVDCDVESWAIIG